MRPFVFALKAGAALVVAGVALVAAANVHVVRSAEPFVFRDAGDVPQRYCAVVPGAGVRNGVVSDVLRDRLDSAAALLSSGRSERILVSGDHGRGDYDEVNAALGHLRSLGVDGGAVFLDHAGFSTWDTAARARRVFLVDGCVAVTQEFHVHRTVFLARAAGLDCVGLVAPARYPYPRRALIWWNVRELLARTKAVLTAWLSPEPRFLGEEIPITGDAEKTRG